MRRAAADAPAADIISGEWRGERGEGREKPGGVRSVTQAVRTQREVHYAGRVQGVGFRYTVRSLAAGFDVTGFVRNLPDGRVQLVAEGESGEVEAFLDAVKAEMAHYIDTIQEQSRPAGGRFQNFQISH